MSRSLIGLFLVALGGCTSDHSATALDANHPANPDAPTTAAHTETHDHAAGPSGHQHHATTAVPASAPVAAQMYECPMHPKVRSTNPEDRCPECGMKINKKVPQENPQ